MFETLSDKIGQWGNFTRIWRQKGPKHTVKCKVVTRGRGAPPGRFATTMTMMRSLLALLLLAPASANIPVLTHVRCESEYIAGGYAADLTPFLSLHWKLSQGKLSMIADYAYRGWIGIGFSSEGKMIGSKAVIGREAGIDWVSLVSQPVEAPDISTAFAVDTAGTARYNIEGNLVEVHGRTQLVFTMDYLDDLPGNLGGGQQTFLFAAHDSMALGYHLHRGHFHVDLSRCGTSTGVSQTELSNATYDHKAAFAAHGFFATLALAVIVPVAIAAAWARALMPKWWIYVHVLANCLGFFFTMLAVAVAFGAMSMRGKAGGVETHMTLSHHWVGLTLFIIMFIQVAGGFRRPPVEAKLDSVGGFAEPAAKCLCCTIPQTRREFWHAFHALTAFVVVVMAIWQLQSGLKLFTFEYTGTEKVALTIYWVWMGVQAVFLVGLRCYARRKEGRLAATPTNLMPQRSEEEEDASPRASETRAFANII